jgi:hypothetical protein
MTELNLNSSSYGFRSIKPKSREERRAMNDNATLEKNRVNQRVGCEARMIQANTPKHSSQLTSCVSEGAGYISNADRFNCDTAGEEYAARQEALQKKNRALDFRRNQVFRNRTCVYSYSNMTITFSFSCRTQLEKKVGGSKSKTRKEKMRIT